MPQALPLIKRTNQSVKIICIQSTHQLEEMLSHFKAILTVEPNDKKEI